MVEKITRANAGDFLMYADAEWLSGDEWERLPLFPHLPPCPSVLLNAEANFFADPFLTELAMSKPLQRLKDIGFLGALDYIKVSNGRDAHRRRHNRFDHSLGVAELALLYADIRGLPRKATRVLAAMAHCPTHWSRSSNRPLGSIIMRLGSRCCMARRRLAARFRKLCSLTALIWMKFWQ